MWAIAQDGVGFLWVGAEGGLFRFDGVEFERWAPEVLEAAVSSVAVSPSGQVVAPSLPTVKAVHGSAPSGG